MMQPWRIEEPVLFTRPHRRRTCRRAVHLRCEVVADIGFRLLGSEILDLSTEGLLVATRGAYARIGESVYVSFKPSVEDDFIDATGTITRIARGRRGAERTPALGVRFDEIAPIDRALLAVRLKGRPPPVPARRAIPNYAAAVAAIASR